VASVAADKLDRTERAIVDQIAALPTLPKVPPCEARGRQTRLDRLARAGFLEVTYRRLNGRQGPGAGRPSKLYRRSDRQISISVPERRYELLAQLFAGSLQPARAGRIKGSLTRAARKFGRALAATSRAHQPATRGCVRALREVLDGLGAQPYADGAVLNIIPDLSTQEAQFGAGKIDIYGAPAADIDDLKKANPRATVVEYVPLGLAFLFFYNVTAADSVFKDPRVRQAASLAIDRQGIIDAIYGGKGVFVNVVPPGLGKWSLDPLGKDIGDPGKWFKHDVQQAKQLLTAAGAIGTDYKFYYPNNAYGDTFNAYADAARGMLSDAGFKVQSVPVDYLKDWIDTQHGYWSTDALPQNGIGHGLQTPFTDPDDYLTGMLTKGGNRDHSRVDDADLSALILKQQVEQDQNKRVQLVYDATRAADNKVYYVPTVYTKAYAMVQQWVQNYWPVDDYDFATEQLAYVSVNNR